MGSWFSASEAAETEPWRLTGQGASWDSAVEREPWSLEPRSLERWYNDNIQFGTEVFDRDCRAAVDRVVRSVHRICSTNGDLFDVDRVVKGGSLGKGTMVKGLSDVDLVAFVNPPHLRPISSLPTPQHYRDFLQAVIEDLKKALSRLEFVEITRSDAFLVNFKIQVRPGGRWLDVDLLPTADNFTGQSITSVFREMLNLRGYDRGFYSASLVKHQRDFVGSQPGYVKELVRLVKYWAYDCLPKNLQKSYPLELITIYRWEEAGKPARFSKAQGLKDVLQTLTNLTALRHYWQRHYNADLAEQSIRELRHRNPILLDPANPTNNACWVYQRGENTTLIRDAAESTLQSTLLGDVIVYPNWRG